MTKKTESSRIWPTGTPVGVNVLIVFAALWWGYTPKVLHWVCLSRGILFPSILSTVMWGCFGSTFKCFCSCLLAFLIVQLLTWKAPVSLFWHDVSNVFYQVQVNFFTLYKDFMVWFHIIITTNTIYFYEWVLVVPSCGGERFCESRVKVTRFITILCIIGLAHLLKLLYFLSYTTTTIYYIIWF